ncbi:flagellar biosynthetic protein FlhB [Lachnospiraceae bacterium]|nr:flagellar biosynthetic protein FlhB [Lachnospiraceae bacterium]
MISTWKSDDCKKMNTLRLPLDLQFFAKEGPGGEKTEEPTSKKLSDARKEGQVAKSQEMNSAVALITLFLVLRFAGSYIAQNFLDVFNWIYNDIPAYCRLTNGKITVHDYTVMLNFTLVKILLIMLPVIAVACIALFVSNVLQVKWQPTLKPLRPKLNKISPLSGIKRLFSVQKLVELLKSVIKIAIIVGVAYSALRNRFGMIMLLSGMSLMGGFGLVLETVVDVGFRISILYFVFGIADYIYNRWKFHQDMKMTKQEVKDEWKNSEGDPQIKGKIRQKMQEASRRRMMDAVPKADVVITNPTHYAVALRYDQSVAAAPIVTAKGADFMAQKIKDVARENGVEIVENKPLARMLYHNVEIGELIPPELYQAVAEVIAFVYSLREEKNGAGRGSGIRQTIQVS